MLTATRNSCTFLNQKNFLQLIPGFLARGIVFLPDSNFRNSQATLKVKLYCLFLPQQPDNTQTETQGSTGPKCMLTLFTCRGETMGRTSGMELTLRSITFGKSQVVPFRSHPGSQKCCTDILQCLLLGRVVSHQLIGVKRETLSFLSPVVTPEVTNPSSSSNARYCKDTAPPWIWETVKRISHHSWVSRPL